MKEYLSKIQPKHYGIISAILAMIGIYIIFALCQFVGAGKYIIMDADMIMQYVPYIKMFVRDLLDGESIWYSWSVSLGMNTSLVNAYYVLSPFNILYLIFWGVDENIITTLIIVLKVGLAAYTFHMFSSRVLKCTGVESILFSLTYSLSMYMVLYGRLYNSWLEGMYMLPLICTLIYELSDKKSYLKLTAAYAYIFVTQFYFAYMVGFFSLAFWILLLVTKEKTQIKEYIVRTVKYIGSVILAVGISALFIFPVFLFILNHSAADATAFSELTTSLQDVYFSLFWGNRVPFDNGYPTLYCGWPVLLLVPAYFVNRNISLKEKIGSGVMVILLVLTMLVDPLYQFMHAFDAPDYFNFRHAFLLVFILCAISCKQAKFFKEINIKLLVAVMFVQMTAFPVLKWLVGEEAAFPGMRIAVNMAIPVLWLGFWFMQKKKGVEPILLALCSIILVMTEMIGNGWYGIEDPASRTKADYECWKTGLVSVTEELEKDNSFYRVYYDNDMVDNSDSWFGYNGISDFCSAENFNLRQSLRFLGIYSTPRRTCHFGITPPIEMLLGVKYYAEGPNPYMPYATDNTYLIAENPYYLGLGFMANEKIAQCQYDSWVAFDNVNSVMSALCGEDIECFRPYSGNVMVKCTQAEIKPEEDKITVSYDSEEYTYGMVTYYIEEDLKLPVYAQFINDYSFASEKSPYLYLGKENNVFQFGKLSIQYAKPMVEYNDRYEMSIVFNKTTADEWSYREAVFYEYDESALVQAYNNLSTNCMSVEEYKDGYVRGNVIATETKSILFTSIPYDEGWKVKVDGQSVEPIAVLENAFMAVELEPGYHELEFEYQAPGVRSGSIISGLSIVIYISAIIFDRRKNKNEENSEISGN